MSDMANKCLECGIEFIPQNRSDQKYCSPECNRIVNLRRISERNSAKVLNGVKCKICNQVLRAISNTHLVKHDMTMKDYQEKFPGEILSEDTRQKKEEGRAKVDYAEKTKKHKETHRKRKIEKFGDLTPKQMQICYGGLLGDFGIHAYTKNRLSGNYLECYHCEEQVTYLRWIEQELASLDCKFHEWTRYWEEYGREYTRYWITTTCHPTITDLRKFTYANEGLDQHKRITREWLDKLEPLGLAVWFMDDGGKCGAGCQISTQCFSYEEQEVIQRYFVEKWNIKTNINKAGTSKDGTQQFYLYFEKEEVPKLANIIRPHLLPMFLYKINEEGKNDNS